MRSQRKRSALASLKAARNKGAKRADHDVILFDDEPHAPVARPPLSAEEEESDEEEEEELNSDEERELSIHRRLVQLGTERSSCVHFFPSASKFPCPANKSAHFLKRFRANRCRAIVHLHICPHRKGNVHQQTSQSFQHSGSYRIRERCRLSP